ncbi:MAG TPA: TadE/TadG family type IV pilus assembly protein [Allosphingosinicella sp.]|jgi:Flp pilus assembly protein TadG
MLQAFRKKRNPDGRAPQGLLGRLLKDSRGNTLAIVGAAMVPLAGMIGSGLDMSRAYMAKTRLQSACDAASLAGRRVMANDTVDQNVTDEATKFFNFNFPQRLYQTATFTPVVSKPKSGTVRVTAATTVPTTIMKLFGYTSLPINVTCDASLNFVNTDIVLVLDTTGSMLCATNEASCSNSTEKSTSKIKALREAVLALYDQLKPIQDQLEANGLRLRFGIVPYSSGVNVGNLIKAVNSSYLVDTWHYQSRRPVYVESQTPRTYNNQTRTDCNGRAVARSPATGFPYTETTVVYNRNTSVCTATTTTYGLTASNTFGYWLYGEATFDTSQYKLGGAVPNPARHPIDEPNLTSTWAGCIEERDTVSTIDANSGYSIPGGAKDLDIDLIPTTDATRWRPYWPDVEYRPDNGGHPQVACPQGAKRLQAWTKSDLSNYLNTLFADGGTYHDNGIIWGGRLISNAGVFGADNPDTYNGMPVARHIIFMTDGLLDTGSTIYSTYGMEYWDERVTGGYSTGTDQDNRHRQRFKMMCNAVKGKNVSIWVVAFASTLDTDLTQCASSASQASVSTDRDALIDKFTEIGKNIGSLRLTQ